jgi:hypothetical protein
MALVTLVQVVALVAVGLLAGIFLGYRAGVQYALPELSASSFVQLQRIIHVHYVKFMPPLVLTALLSSVLWLVLIRSQWRTAEFWLVAISACGILVIAAATPKASAEKQRLTMSLASNSDLVARSGTNRSTTKNIPNKPATTTRVMRAGIIGNRFREAVPHSNDISLPDATLGSDS